MGWLVTATVFGGQILYSLYLCKSVRRINLRPPDTNELVLKMFELAPN